MAPKKKAQKMALADFFADPATGSWEDEAVNLPTAPAMRDSTAPRRGEPGYLDSMPDRGARGPLSTGPPREELPLPTVPPFTAYVGNLTFETEEEALRDFFADNEPSTVRLVKDATGKSKGFGYVEFPSQDKLKDALGKSMLQMMGRTIRISVAEAPSTSRRDGGYGPSVADGADQWRRTTPLSAREPLPTARRQSSHTEAAPGPDRDWSAARGARFSPSVPPTPGMGGPGGLRRDSSGPGREREFVPSAADEVDQWRSAKPLVEAKGARDQRPAVLGSGQSSPSMAETETTWSRGTKLKTPVMEQAPRSGTGSPAEEREWRGSRATSAVPSTDGESPRQAHPAPLERRKLSLAPRSVPATPSSTAPSENSADSKGIFGTAKPIDSAAKEREAEEKLAQKAEGRRKAREDELKKQKEEADKGRQLAEEKAKMIREAQEKARAEAATTTRKTASSPPVTRGRGGAPGHGGRGGGQQQQYRRPSQDARRPSQDADKTRPNPVVSEDGFEGVTKGARARETGQSAHDRPKKESTTRQGFSFAAAASKMGVLEDEGEGEGEGEGDEEGEGRGKNGVEGVTNGVNEVNV